MKILNKFLLLTFILWAVAIINSKNANAIIVINQPATITSTNVITKQPDLFYSTQTIIQTQPVLQRIVPLVQVPQQAYVYEQPVITKPENYHNVASKTPFYLSAALTIGSMKATKVTPTGMLNPTTKGMGVDLALGKYLSERWRGQISLGHTNYTGDKSFAPSKVELDNSVLDLMLSTEYDFIKIQSFSIFAGLGVGVGFNNSKMISTVGAISESDKVNSTNPQAALSLGINIDVSDNIDLFAKYSYAKEFGKDTFNMTVANPNPNYSFSGGNPIYSNPDKQDVKVGIRYKF